MTETNPEIVITQEDIYAFTREGGISLMIYHGYIDPDNYDRDVRKILVERRLEEIEQKKKREEEDNKKIDEEVKDQKKVQVGDDIEGNYVYELCEYSYRRDFGIYHESNYELYSCSYCFPNTYKEYINRKKTINKKLKV
jgi:hypothetical protein